MEQSGIYPALVARSGRTGLERNGVSPEDGSLLWSMGTSYGTLLIERDLGEPKLRFSRTLDGIFP